MPAEGPNLYPRPAPDRRRRPRLPRTRAPSTAPGSRCPLLAAGSGDRHVVAVVRLGVGVLAGHVDARLAAEGRSRKDEAGARASCRTASVTDMRPKPSPEPAVPAM